jgi:hypothetical protein
MRIIVFSVLFLMSAGAYAIGVDPYNPIDRGKPLSKSEQTAIRTLLKTADCNYATLLSGVPLWKEWLPNILDFPNSCPGEKGKTKPACVGTIYCKTKILDFAVSKAICWSRDGKHCPPPAKCAEQSIFTAVETWDVIGENGFQAPVYFQPRESGTVK